MPKIFEYFGLVFYFWSDEHLPIHVHVTKGELESVFELLFTDGILTDIKLKKTKGEKQSLNESDIKKAKSFIQVYHAAIVEKWFQFFVLEMAIKSTKIEKQLQSTIDTQKVVEQLEALDKKKYPNVKKTTKNK